MTRAAKKVLIVGAGRIAGLNERDPARRKPCTHAGAILSQPGLELAGVVDLDLERAREFARGFDLAFAGTDISAAMAQIRPDIVTVAVPYRIQHDVVMGIAGGPHRPHRMLLEKPLADDLARAETLVSACRDTGIDLLISNECVAPVYDQIRSLIADRFGDEVISASAWCSSGMHAVGIHMIGILRHLFGEVAWVRAVGETEYVDSLPFSANFVPDDPRVHGMLIFRNSVSAFLTNSALTRYTYKEIEIICRDGKIRLSDNGNLLQLWSTAEPGTSTLSYKLSEPETIPVEPGTAFGAIGRCLAAAENVGHSIIGGAQGLATYGVLDALIRSAREDREIHLSQAPGRGAIEAQA